MFQILRVVITLGLFIPIMWAFMHFVRPYSDTGSSWLLHQFGFWPAVVIMLGIPALVAILGKVFERPANAPPSRFDWLLKRRY